MTFPSPLLDHHRQAEAEFQDWADIPIVQTFGQPQAEYAAIRKSVGLIDLPQRGILELTGKDRLPFLNNLLTNQTWDKAAKAGLKPGEGIYGFILNLAGRIVADMNVLGLGESTLIEAETRLIEPLRQLLDKYLFTEQVKIVGRVGELHEIALHGPGASDILQTALGKPLQSTRVKLFEVDVIIWRDDPAGVPGYHLIIPTTSIMTVWKNLLERFGERYEGNKRLLRPIGWAAFNTAQD